LLAFIHILLAAPRFAFLDRIATAFGSEQSQQMLQMLSKNSITYINSAKAATRLTFTTRYWSAVRTAAGRGTTQIAQDGSPVKRVR
jgi:ABC-type uncharacterized transport system fused permease/ATPase subunit